MPPRYAAPMPFVGDQVAVRQDGVKTWRLLEPLRYEANRECFLVPTGSVTDFASVPRPLTWLVPTYGRYTRCAVLHDFLCEAAKTKRFSRYDADGIFLSLIHI